MTEQAQPIEQAPDSLEGIEYVGMSDAPDTNAEPEAKDEPLELGGDDAPEATPEQVAEDKDKKGRSKRWESRVDNLTARLRDAERRAAEAEAKAAGLALAPKDESVEEVMARKPNPDEFQFGIADPDYGEQLTDWKMDVREAQRGQQTKQAREQEAKAAEQNAVTKRLTEGMASIEKTGAEKYDDFQDKITEAVEARGGEPLPALVSVGIAVSPAGADIAYHLATNEEASEKLEKLAQTNPQQAAIMFGELEGQYLEDDDSDLNPGDQWDVLRMLGRERARRKGLKATERKVSKAPEPPENRARGASGRFEPDWSADNVDLTALGKML